MPRVVPAPSGLRPVNPVFLRSSFACIGRRFRVTLAWHLAVASTESRVTARPQMETSRMRWSTKLGRFAGIDVYVHVTFLLLIAWFALLYWNQTHTLAGVLSGLS